MIISIGCGLVSALLKDKLLPQGKRGGVLTAFLVIFEAIAMIRVFTTDAVPF